MDAVPSPREERQLFGALSEAGPALYCGLEFSRPIDGRLFVDVQHGHAVSGTQEPTRARPLVPRGLQMQRSIRTSVDRKLE